MACSSHVSSMLSYLPFFNMCLTIPTHYIGSRWPRSNSTYIFTLDKTSYGTKSGTTYGQGSRQHVTWTCTRVLPASDLTDLSLSSRSISWTRHLCSTIRFTMSFLELLAPKIGKITTPYHLFTPLSLSLVTIHPQMTSLTSLFFKETLRSLPQQVEVTITSENRHRPSIRM